MREIKFRLTRGGKIVGYEKHVVSCGRVDIFQSIKNDDEDGWEWWNICVPFAKKPYIECDNKDQFTGLLDKNGKEIYEGDVCHVKYYDKTQDCTYTNTFLYEDNGRAFFSEGCYQIECNETAYIKWFESVEVVGNRHENPELLEAPNAR